MTSACFVVIGHVDHGKTALVRALTGIETDRTAEEKARGLSIVAGFAHKRYDSFVADFVDAPGHEDFVQAMIGAASGARAALIVVSAVEGMAAQTREHLKIATLLGLTRAVIALTKSDLLDAQAAQSALAKLQSDLRGNAFEGAPIILCSAQTGYGLDQLEDALQLCAAQPPVYAGPARATLPIDRVFTVPGRGTVVTGTLLGRSLSRNDQLVLHPSARSVSIRGLQSRGAECDHAAPGTRVALNLRGIDAAYVSRGDVLSAPDTSTATLCFDIQLLSTTQILKHMQELRVSFGTTHAVATLRLYRKDSTVNKDGRLAQLRFKTAHYAYAGQRAVLRRLSPVETLEGAVILDPMATATGSGDAARRCVLSAAADRAPARIARALCEADGGAGRLADFARLSRQDVDTARALLGAEFIALGDDFFTTPASVSRHQARIIETLQTFHADHPLRVAAPLPTLANRKTAPALQDYALAELRQSNRVRQRDGTIALADHDPVALMSPAQRKRLDALDVHFAHAGVAPSATTDAPTDQLDAQLVTLLIDTGRLLALHNVALRQTVVLHKDAIERAIDSLHTAFGTSTAFTVSQARSTLGTSRRIIVPLLEFLDAQGVTHRTGDTRVLTGDLSVPTPQSSC